jgi:hypothetical protein
VRGTPQNDIRNLCQAICGRGVGVRGASIRRPWLGLHPLRGWVNKAVPAYFFQGRIVAGSQKVFKRFSMRPSFGGPASKTRASKTLICKAPSSKEPTSIKPTFIKPTSEKLTSEKLTSEQPTSKKPTSKKPTSKEPTSKEPTSIEPTSEEPTSIEPISEEPTSENSYTSLKSKSKLR